MRRPSLLLLCVLFALPGVLSAQTPLPPVIVEQPTGVSAYIGDTVTLRAVIDGTAPISFLWYRNGSSLGWATDSTLTLTSVALTDTAIYHLVATNAHGTASTAPVGIYVSKRPQTITFTPASGSVVAGSGITLTATSSANLPVTLTLVSGAASLNGSVLTGVSGNVVVRASQAGNSTIAAAESVERTYTFVAGALAPFLSSPPVDQTVVSGATATFRAAAIGSPAPTYQWKKDGADLPGATNPSLALPATTLADAGRYAVTATNASGSVTAAATLVVQAAPVITDAPASRAVYAGDSVSLAVAVTGVPAPTYQWRKNGAAIPGATGATLAFATVLATDAGRYEVTVSNSLGSVVSPPATLDVTTRDFTGAYFGRFGGEGGDFALFVRPDNTSVFLGHLPGRQAAIAVLDLKVDLAGNFSVRATTLAAAPQAITLRGSLNETTGALVGEIAELGATLEGARAARTGPAAANEGLYPVALLGTAFGGHLLVAPDGQAFLLAAGSTPDSARGVISSEGRLAVTTVSAQASIDLVCRDGALSGTSRAGAGAAGVLAGAVESRAASGRLSNLSVRAITAPGPTTLIAGFVITGSASKQVLLRAAGPALAVAPFNVAGTVADPTIQLFRGATRIGQNDDWDAPAANANAVRAATVRTGAFPFRVGAADSALVPTLTPGAYTFIAGGGNGVVLAEIYETLPDGEAAGTRRLVNVSARGVVTAASPLIAGFVVAGPAPRLVLVRGVAPTLGAAPFNLESTLPNPRLTLMRDTTAVKANDDWFRDADAGLIRAASARVGAFALGASSQDAAVLLYLAPGAYTAQVSGPPGGNAANTTGLAMVEVYDATP